MKLPNCEQTEVPDRKLGGYLLDHNHPQNGGKAAFYELVGFTAGNTHELRKALQQHVSEHDVVKTMPGEFGVRYVIEGTMACPNGKQYSIRSVWFISNSENIPKLVTAYPN